MPYTIDEHKHRFAAWAASRAASVNPNRFRVEVGKKIIDELRIRIFINDPDRLPDINNIDKTHRSWRSKTINIANDNNILLTHGTSAKLINIYFKSIFVCGGDH